MGDGADDGNYDEMKMIEMPISLFFSFDLLLRASSAGRGGFAQCRQLPAPLPHSPEQAAIVKIIKIIKIPIIIKIVKIVKIIKITIIIMCIVVIAIVVSSPLDDLCIDISAMIVERQGTASNVLSL